ncbi:MAG: SMI1/KNR4 family protein [Deltaproteobacteria bacterium]|nr:SMI1/KNR4 family protein [Deltaproteobacteria bacterium]
MPKSYLDLLRRFPDELADKLTEQQPQPDERMLFTDAETVVAQNEEVRTEDIWTEEGPWPPGHLVIGADHGGDKWSLDAKDRKIYRLLHESGTLEEQAANVEQWLEMGGMYLDGDEGALDGAAPSPAKGQPVLPKPVDRRQANVHKYLLGWLERDQEAIAKNPDDPTGWKDRAGVIGSLLFAEDGDEDCEDYLGAYQLAFDSIDALADAALEAHEDLQNRFEPGTSAHRSAGFDLERVQQACRRWRTGDVKARRALLQARFDATGDDYYAKELAKLG